MKKSIWFFSTVLILFISFGCSSSDESSVSSDSESDKTETSFNFTMSSFLKQETASSSERQASFTADQIMTGTLTATNTDDSSVQTFDWSIYLDEETFDVQSNKTIILAPGTYDFSLLLTKGDQQYAGTTLGQAISDGTFDVPMTIRPVIGETVTDVSVVATLADFRFQYDPAELSTLSLSVPQLGITVDGGTEQIFAINTTTGITDDFINLEQGSHTIQVALYDGSLQKGRSISAQETVVVSAGTNITMDLVALHGEATFALTEAGGDAIFSFNIPAEVVDEAGGLANLEVLFTLDSPENGTTETSLSLTEDGAGNYEADLTLSDMQYDTMTIQLVFNDLSESPKEQLGSCVETTTLDITQRTVNCGITLRRRAVIGGNLLATLGINVFNEAGEPVSGASVYSDEVLIGITGDGTFGTDGYLKVYLTAGSYTIKASDTVKFGEATFSLDAMSINNQDLVLSTDETSGLPLFEDFNSLLFDETKWGNLSSHGYEVVNGELILDLRHPPGDHDNPRTMRARVPANRKGAAADFRVIELGGMPLDHHTGLIWLWFYRDTTNMPIGVHFEGHTNGPVIHNIFRCTDINDCEGNNQSINYGSMDGTFTLGQTHHLSVSWNGSTTFTFRFNGDTKVIDVGVSAPFQSADVPDNDIVEIVSELSSTNGSYHRTAVDNVEIDMVGDETWTTFETYSSPEIDTTKWEWMEMKRIKDGKLRLGHVNNDPTGLANVEFAPDPETDWPLMPEEVSFEVNSVRQSGSGRMMFHGPAYYDGTGLVSGIVMVSASDIEAMVWRCQNWPCEWEDRQGPILWRQVLGSNTPGQLHTIDLKWENYQYIFTLNSDTPVAVDLASIGAPFVEQIMKGFFIFSQNFEITSNYMTWLHGVQPYGEGLSEVEIDNIRKSDTP